MKGNLIPFAMVSAIVFASVLFSACSDGGIIKDERKAASIYVDLLVAQEKKRGTDTLKLKQARQSVYRKHGVTEEEFRATLSYYNERQERWQNFFDQVNEVLIARKRENSKKL